CPVDGQGGPRWGERRPDDPGEGHDVGVGGGWFGRGLGGPFAGQGPGDGASDRGAAEDRHEEAALLGLGLSLEHQWAARRGAGERAEAGAEVDEEDALGRGLDDGREQAAAREAEGGAVAEARRGDLARLADAADVVAAAGVATEDRLDDAAGEGAEG